MDEENPTYAGLAQENGFGSTLLLCTLLPWLCKSLAEKKSVINMI
jgi:hypothetical protein